MIQRFGNKNFKQNHRRELKRLPRQVMHNGYIKSTSAKPNIRVNKPQIHELNMKITQLQNYVCT